MSRRQRRSRGVRRKTHSRQSISCPPCFRNPLSGLLQASTNKMIKTQDWTIGEGFPLVSLGTKLLLFQGFRSNLCLCLAKVTCQPSGGFLFSMAGLPICVCIFGAGARAGRWLRVLRHAAGAGPKDRVKVGNLPCATRSHPTLRHVDISTFRLFDF